MILSLQHLFIEECQNVSSLPTRKDPVCLVHPIIACLASDRWGSSSESAFWSAALSDLSHRRQEVILVQFSLYVACSQ